MTKTARSLKFNPVVYTPKPGEPKWEHPVQRGTPPPMKTIGPYDPSKDKSKIRLLRDLMISGSFLREILGPFQRGEHGKGREHFELQKKQRETFGPQDKRKIA